MFDKLLDLILRFLDLFIPWTVVDSYQRGYVLRFGKKARLLSPGFHWVWPLGVERVLLANTTLDAIALPPQALETRDGVSVVAQLSVLMHVEDIEKYLIDIEGVERLIHEVAPGVVAMFIRRRTFAEMRDPDLDDDIQRAIGKLVKPWGVKIEGVAWKNLARCRSVRLVTDSGKAG